MNVRPMRVQSLSHLMSKAGISGAAESPEAESAKTSSTQDSFVTSEPDNRVVISIPKRAIGRAGLALASGGLGSCVALATGLSGPIGLAAFALVGGAIALVSTSKVVKAKIEAYKAAKEEARRQVETEKAEEVKRRAETFSKASPEQLASTARKLFSGKEVLRLKHHPDQRTQLFDFMEGVVRGREMSDSSREYLQDVLTSARRIKDREFSPEIFGKLSTLALAASEFSKETSPLDEPAFYLRNTSGGEFEMQVGDISKVMGENALLKDGIRRCAEALPDWERFSVLEQLEKIEMEQDPDLAGRESPERYGRRALYKLMSDVNNTTGGATSGSTEFSSSNSPVGVFFATPFAGNGQSYQIGFKNVVKYPEPAGI